MEKTAFESGFLSLNKTFSTTKESLLLSAVLFSKSGLDIRGVCRCVIVGAHKMDTAY